MVRINVASWQTEVALCETVDLQPAVLLTVLNYSTQNPSALTRLAGTAKGL